MLSEPNQEKTQKKILPSSQDSIFLLIFLVELAYEKSMLTLSMDYYDDYRKSWCVCCCLQEQNSFLINFKKIINFCENDFFKAKIMAQPNSRTHTLAWLTPIKAGILIEKTFHFDVEHFKLIANNYKKHILIKIRKKWTPKRHSPNQPRSQVVQEREEREEE